MANARESLDAYGIVGGLDAINLDSAIADVEVPRGSAYRLFQSATMTPQDVFRREVAIEILRDYPATIGLPLTITEYEEALETLTERVDPGDDNAMRSTLLELIRVVTGENFDRLDNSQNWRIYSALRTAALTRHGSDPELLEAVRTGEEAVISGYAALYERIATMFGHEIREPFTYAEFSATIYALNEGLANRVTDVYRRRDIKLPSGPEGEMQEWTLFAASFTALIDYFFVPVA